jgi:hypothetical protein
MGYPHQPDDPEPDELPWICPDHPTARIRHYWDQTHCVLNGLPAGTGTKSSHRYECEVCRLELAQPNSQPPARLIANGETL